MVEVSSEEPDEGSIVFSSDWDKNPTYFLVPRKIE